ncbi:hypothetical protein BGV49_22040 [Burkholderia ubonensis]|nr:hypothetical protein BGV49_22040 [Burkholderia ubonensis]
MFFQNTTHEIEIFQPPYISQKHFPEYRRRRPAIIFMQFNIHILHAHLEYTPLIIQFLIRNQMAKFFFYLLGKFFAIFLPPRSQNLSLVQFLAECAIFSHHRGAIGPSIDNQTIAIGQLRL